MENYNFENYTVNGVSLPFNLSDQYKDKLKENYEEFQNNAKKIMGREIHVKPHLLSRFFCDIAHDSNIIKKVKKIIGDNVLLWSSAFFCKRAKTERMISWHQDSPFWQLTTSKVCTAWIAITNVNEENGAMQMIPGSHRNGIIGNLDVDNAREAYLKGQKTTEDKDMLSFKHNIDDYVKKNKKIFINLKPGEFSLHHVDMVHGSASNSSDKDRIGFALRYISSDTKHQIEKNDSAMLVSGKCDNGFSLEKKPEGEFDLKSIKEFEKGVNGAGGFGNKKY